MSSQTMNLKREGHTPSDEADRKSTFFIYVSPPPPTAKQLLCELYHYDYLLLVLVILVVLVLLVLILLHLQ